MAKRKKDANKDRIARIYDVRCDRVQIPIMETVTIMNQGLQAIALNPTITDQELGDKIAAYVETVRTN